jgi:hypothetical protein
MTDQTTGEIKCERIDDSHSECALLRALNDTIALVQQLRAEDLTAEEGILLRRLLRELIELNRLSGTPS